jgi:hypothetical protein
MIILPADFYAWRKVDSKYTVYLLAFPEKAVPVY